jgi:hypothetical protein
MRHDEADDIRLLDALRGMWEHRDPPPDGLDALALAAVERAGLDDELIVLELFSDDTVLPNVRGEGARTLRFVSDGVEVLLRIERDRDGFRIDGWSVPAREGIVHLDVDGHERAAMSDALGRFAFAGIGQGHAVVSLSLEPDDPPVWTTRSFAL